MKGFLTIILVSYLISISECEVSETAKRIVEKLRNIKKFHNSFKSRKLQTDLNPEPSGDNVIPSNRNKKAGLQFLDINRYEPVEASEGHKAFKFNIFFYFWNMTIPFKIFVPMKVNLGRLRSLEEKKIESECTQIGTATEEDAAGGQTQKYDCKGDVETNGEIKGLSISTNEPVTAQIDGKNSTVATDNINFSPSASTAGSDVTKAEANFNKVVVLQNGVLASQLKDKFAINGDLVNDIKDGDSLPLDLYDDNTKSYKKIFCTVKRNSDKAVTLNCDTDGENLNANLDMESGVARDIKVFLNMTEGNEKIEINDGNSTTPSSNNISYRKSSSGLSGGAIAGIVIACVVVLIAASVSAMMLRKPTVKPPIDNTTSVQLRSSDNI